MAEGDVKKKEEKEMLGLFRIINYFFFWFS